MGKMTIYKGNWKGLAPIGFCFDPGYAGTGISSDGGDLNYVLSRVQQSLNLGYGIIFDEQNPPAEQHIP